MSGHAHRLLKEFNPQKRDLHILHDHPNPSVEYEFLVYDGNL
jgi:hypothetical protein